MGSARFLMVPIIKAKLSEMGITASKRGFIIILSKNKNNKPKFNQNKGSFFKFLMLVDLSNFLCKKTDNTKNKAGRIM